MSIGEVLADARCRLGLSVGEVSRRTRIRATIIWGIEQDDYSACGGNFYVRGHIRAMAGAVGVDPAPLIHQFDATHQSAEEDSAALADLRPAAPSRPRPRNRVAWIAALCVAVLAIFGWAAYHLASTAGHPPGGKAVAAADRVPASHQARHSKPRPSPSPPRPSPAPARSTAAPTPTVVPVRALAPVRAVAFGPDGPGQGDDPQSAPLAIDGSGATAWHSDWYTTAEFGNLQSGTGLLIDMGRRVTVTAARITLGGLPGARCAPATCSSGSPGCPRTSRAPTRPASPRSPCRASPDARREGICSGAAARVRGCSIGCLGQVKPGNPGQCFAAFLAFLLLDAA